MLMHLPEWRIWRFVPLGFMVVMATISGMVYGAFF
jgi:hypothetical protein